MHEEQSHQLNAIGVELYNQGKFEQALKYFEDAIFLYSKNVQAYNNLGLCYIRLKQFLKGVDFFKKALEINPLFEDASLNLANCYFLKKNYQNALIYYYKSKKTLDKYPKNYLNLGEIYLELGRPKDAEESYRKLIAIDPKNYDAYNNLGVTLNRQNKFKESNISYKKAIKLNPERSDTYFNMAISYSKKEDYETAVVWFKKALQVKPGDPQPLAHLVNRLSYLCEWKDRKVLGEMLDETTSRQLKEGVRPAEQPFMNIIRVDNPERNLLLAKIYSQDLESYLKNFRDKLNFKFEKNNRKKIKKFSSKIRIGYASDGFRNFPTAQNLSRVLELHDRSKFEIYLYSFGENDNTIWRKRAEALADSFVDISKLDFIDSAKRIYQDKLDILVDLKGFTGGNRIQIMALKPAPIIVSLLGFVGSTGSSFHDYLIVDKTIVPENEQKYYSEKIIYMPNTYWPTDSSLQLSAISYQRKDFGIPENAFVFCAFHTSYKIEPEVFKVWVSILKKVPKSVLWLLWQNKTQVKNLKSAAKKMGVNINRLIFSPSQPKLNHLARIKLADLSLDTRIVNGHTTTTDCLFAGVPVITILGNHFASRVSASMLKAIGLPELITKNLKEYEDLAIKLATNPKKLQTITYKLQTNLRTHPLFDTKKYTGNLEKIFIDLYNRKM